MFRNFIENAMIGLDRGNFADQSEFDQWLSEIEFEENQGQSANAETHNDMFGAFSTWLTTVTEDGEWTPITGTVLQVSSDKYDDPRTGEIYYLAKGRLPDSLAPTFSEIQITPAMQAEVYINTGERTLFEYFLQPVERSFKKAFRED